LSRWLIYDNLTDKKYISSYCTWEGSILSPKIFLLQHPYPSLSRGEDTIVIKQLQKENKIKLLNMPELYTYHLHWKNTYDRNHGLKMIKKSIEIPKKSWKSLRQELILVDENNLPLNLEWEREEQEDIIKYLDSGSSVLELGGRYGVVSCVINKLLNNPERHVVFEPDDLVWNTLEKNKYKNNCKFIIFKGALSLTPLFLSKQIGEKGAGTETLKDGNKQVNIIDHLPFKCDTMVVDCEGCIEQVLRDFPNILNNVKTIFLEKDSPHRVNYLDIKQTLCKNGFKEIKKGFRSVWKKL